MWFSKDANCSVHVWVTVLRGYFMVQSDFQFLCTRQLHQIAGARCWFAPRTAPCFKGLLHGAIWFSVSVHQMVAPNCRGEILVCTKNCTLCFASNMHRPCDLVHDRSANSQAATVWTNHSRTALFNGGRRWKWLQLGTYLDAIFCLQPYDGAQFHCTMERQLYCTKNDAHMQCSYEVIIIQSLKKLRNIVFGGNPMLRFSPNFSVHQLSPPEYKIAK